MKDLTQNLLRYHQREAAKQEIERMDVTIQHADPEDKAVIQRRRARAVKQLESQSPEPLTGAEKDKLHNLEKKLRERITENMPTEEVMRKNPTGAIDWNLKWQAVNKKAIMMWKNIRIQLNPDSSDHDLANIERYRPAGQMDRMRTDAQISGHMTYQNIPEELWPFEAPKNTALAQTKRYEAEQAEKDVDEVIEELETVTKDVGGFGPNGNMSAEEYAAVESRLAKAREAKAAKKKQQEELDAIAAAMPEGELSAQEASVLKTE